MGQLGPFTRAAIRKAIWKAEEQATAQAYARQPDSANEAYIDATAWERRTTATPRQKTSRRNRRRRSRK